MTLGIETVGSHLAAVPVAAGEIVAALSGPRRDDARMLDVRWNHRTMAMLVEDSEARGLEIEGRPSASTA